MGDWDCHKNCLCYSCPIHSMAYAGTPFQLQSSWPSGFGAHQLQWRAHNGWWRDPFSDPHNLPRASPSLGGSMRHAWLFVGSGVTFLSWRSCSMHHTASPKKINREYGASGCVYLKDFGGWIVVKFYRFELHSCLPVSIRTWKFELAVRHKSSSDWYLYKSYGGPNTNLVLTKKIIFFISNLMKKISYENAFMTVHVFSECSWQYFWDYWKKNVGYVSGNTSWNTDKKSLVIFLGFIFIYIYIYIWFVWMICGRSAWAVYRNHGVRCTLGWNLLRGIWTDWMPVYALSTSGIPGFPRSPGAPQGPQGSFFELAGSKNQPWG